MWVALKLSGRPLLSVRSSLHPKELIVIHSMSMRNFSPSGHQIQLFCYLKKKKNHWENKAWLLLAFDDSIDANTELNQLTSAISASRYEDPKISHLSHMSEGIWDVKFYLSKTLQLFATPLCSCRRLKADYIKHTINAHYYLHIMSSSNTDSYVHISNTFDMQTCSKKACPSWLLQCRKTHFTLEGSILRWLRLWRIAEELERPSHSARKKAARAETHTRSSVHLAPQLANSAARPLREDGDGKNETWRKS